MCRVATSTYDLPAALANVPLSQGRLESTVYTLTEAEVRGTSVLPGWSRAHVLAHVAQHGHAMVRLVDGVLTGRNAEQYPGGKAARDADIEAAASRSLDDLTDDVTSADASVVTAFARMTAPTWGRTVHFLSGTFPASRCAWSRWREVEIHHVDLGLDTYTIDSWPDEFLSSHLPHELAKLPSRLPAGTAIKVGGSRFGTGDLIATVDGPDPALLAWLLGRSGLAAPSLTSSNGRLPDLPPWG
jgi:maleylpyruvate isomerase